MTPDAVIFRYLELLREPNLDLNQLVRLICADADLLGRWLTMLGCPADPEQLLSRLTATAPDVLEGLARTQAWSVLPALGTARLSLGQWQGVLESAYIGGALAAAQAASGAAQREEQRVRVQMLLALSGVHIEHDPAMRDLIELRGAPPELLLDASASLKIFAVVEALASEPDTAGRLAELLFDMDPQRYEQLVAHAQSECAADVRKMGLVLDGNIDWSERVWLQQQLQQLGAAFAAADGEAALFAAHTRASRALFTRVPLLLLLDRPTLTLRTQDGGVRIRAGSTSSAVARALRDGAQHAIYDESSAAVADRQLLRQLGVEGGLVLPLPSRFGSNGETGDMQGFPDGVLVFPGDEEEEPVYAMRAYADHLARWVSRRDLGSEPHTSDAGELEAFRDQEVARLRAIVHEVNNPLSVINNYLHVLEVRLKDDAELTEQVQIVRREVQRAATLLQDVKDVAPLTGAEASEPLEMTRTAFDLNGCVRRVLELHEGLAHEHDVQLTRLLPPGDLFVESAEDRLVQILTNLVKNAIEACEPGDVVGIDVFAQAVRRGVAGVELEIHDSGPGLPGDVLLHLGEEQTSSKGDQHEGLGLKVVYELCTALELEINVRSSSTTGTQFNLFIPAPAH